VGEWSGTVWVEGWGKFVSTNVDGTFFGFSWGLGLVGVGVG
jgi:hypothetical protein